MMSDHDLKPFQVHLSGGVMASCVLMAASLTFGVGYLLSSSLLLGHTDAISGTNMFSFQALPPPILEECKHLPHFVYTSKHYSTDVSVRSENLLLRESDLVVDGDNCHHTEQAYDSYSNSSIEHREPAGQHLLVDIENVDGRFLNSEARLAQAMVDLVRDAGITMLSYHCHSMKPVGVSCAGILLGRGHVSFHTWPTEGVITFDIYTSESTSLVPLLTTVKDLFGVPRLRSKTGGDSQEPYLQWAYKLRGFRQRGTSNSLEVGDLHQFLLGWLEYDLKQQVVHIQTDFHDVQIYDVIDSRFQRFDGYKRSLTYDGSYAAKHPELFRPDRTIYLDHSMKSRVLGEAVYHEAFVHPSLITHSNPRRVAIIGGGNGAILREVLKHQTVELVTVIERDQSYVAICREFLPEWSDCSSFGGKKSCFDDPRVNIHYTRAGEWFIDRFGEGIFESDDEKYDVIIIDAEESGSQFEPSDMRYDDPKFVQALSRALTSEGILVSQAGAESDHLDAAAKEFSETTKYELKFLQYLQVQGFVAVKDYSEAHGGFQVPRRFMIAFKSRDTLTSWYANQAEIDQRLHERITSPKTHGENGDSKVLRYFDGATMMTYQFPSRLSEEVFCRSTPQPELCEAQHGVDPYIENIPISSLEVKVSPIPNADGRGVFFKESVKKGRFIAAEELVQSILLGPRTYKLASEMHEQNFAPPSINKYFKVMYSYCFGYGFKNAFYGGTGVSVDPSILYFMNHGCNGTYTQGIPMPFTEMDADLTKMPDIENSILIEAYFYNPFIDRNHLVLMHLKQVTPRDIERGEELLDNYLSFFSEENWESSVRDLRAYCSLQSVGEITRYDEGLNGTSDQ